jgi:hypothetical protein
MVREDVIVLAVLVAAVLLAAADLARISRDGEPRPAPAAVERVAAGFPPVP